LFWHKWWNIYERTLQGDARMNNAVEGSHHHFQTELGFLHSTLTKFISNLQKLQKDRDLSYNEGEENLLPSKKQKYAVNDEAIYSLVEEYDQRTTIKYLHAIAHHLG